MTQVPFPCGAHALTKFVTDALYDPANPTLCAGSLVVALSGLAMFSHGALHTQNTNLDVACRNYLLSTLYVFVIKNGSSAGAKEWTNRFAKCADCTTQDASSEISSFCHVRWTKLMEDTDFMQHQALISKYACRLQIMEEDYPIGLRIFIVQSIFGIYNALVKSSSKSLAQERSKEWPTIISDLTPPGIFGPDRIVDSILRWYRIHPYPVILQTVNRISMLIGSPTGYSLARFNFIPIVVASTKYSLDQARDMLENRSKYSETEQFFICESFIGQNTAFYDIVQALVGYLPGKEKIALMDGQETKVIQICTLTFCIFPPVNTILNHHNSDIMTEDTVDELQLAPIVYGHPIYRDFQLWTPALPEWSAILQTSRM